MINKGIYFIQASQFYDGINKDKNRDNRHIDNN